MKTSITFADLMNVMDIRSMNLWYNGSQIVNVRQSDIHEHKVIATTAKGAILKALKSAELEERGK